MTNKMNWESLLNFSRPGDKKGADHTPDQIRSAFERDYDRIIFSHPFRKLQDKTQVFPIPEHDFVHNRLTHSLEVSSVGRSLGKIVGAAVLEKHQELKTRYSSFDFGAIVAAACLAHDIGNPPFGHSGEEAISSFFKSHEAKTLFDDKLSPNEWKDLQNFEGNAQGFRIINDSGLKLTYATMGAFTKYPHGSLLNEKVGGRKSQKKFGFYQQEKGAFEDMAKALELIPINSESYARHPLVFLVEAADDICYHIIDLEDGCRLGLVSFEFVRDIFAKILGDRYRPEKLEMIIGEAEKISVLRALVINKLIEEVSLVFMSKEDEILSGDFDEALIDNVPSAPHLNEIIKVSIAKLYRAQQVLEKEAGGYQVIEDLLKSFGFAVYTQYFDEEHVTGKTKSVYRMLSKTTQDRLDKEETLYQKLLVVTDFVSGLTDRYAISLFKTLKGISLPIR